MNDRFDLMVVGGGPGGYVAAIRAAQLGFKTALVEKDQLGGICLNWGCIPTKALLRGADIAHTLKSADQFGFTFENLRLDIGTLVAHSRQVAGRLSMGISSLMAKNKITVIDGTACVSDKFELTVADSVGQQRVYRADHIILATGAHPRSLPGVTFDGEHVWGAREAMTPTELPRRLLIIGSGAIGMEFASLYCDLGSEVTVVEIVDRVLPAEDEEVSAAAHKAFRSRGVMLHTSTRLGELRVRNGEVHANLVSPGNQVVQGTFDKVILAAGVAGNIESLGLERLQVKTSNGFIVTDEYGRTNLAGLYAIGDVAGAPCLAHKASHEGMICVEKIAGLSVHPQAKHRIPRCTYSRPQIASIGLTEGQVKAANLPVRVGRFNYRANGKALAMADSEGFVKVIFHADTDELLGAHMIGPEVTEQIQGFGIAQTLEATADDLVASVFAHPTLSECMHEAVLNAYGRAIHS